MQRFCVTDLVFGYAACATASYACINVGELSHAVELALGQCTSNDEHQ